MGKTQRLTDRLNLAKGKSPRPATKRYRRIGEAETRTILEVLYTENGLAELYVNRIEKIENVKKARN